MSLNIGARIRARKQTLSIYYQTLFDRKTSSSIQSGLLDDVFFIDNPYKDITQEARSERAERVLVSDMSRDQKIIRQSDERYGVDGTYIDRMGDISRDVFEIVKKQVNTYVTSFSFDQMDVMDQALFCLWRNEYHIMETPREVLFNELVELAKRFGDDGSAKLINGIIYKIIKEPSVSLDKEKEGSDS